MGGTAGRWRLALGALTLAASAELALPGPAAAQTAFTLGGTPYTLDGDVEVGARFFLAEPSERNTAKFEEYRDIADGLFLEALRLRLARPDESFAIELGGSRWGQTDQDYSLRAGRPGVWDFGFEWDQLRHLYSTTARLLSVDVEPNHFVLPTPRPALSVHNTLSERRDVASQWETMRLWAGFNPVEKLELKAEYSRIHKEGSRPIGMAFGSPSNNFLELLEPIDQTIHDFKLRAAWAEESYQIQFQYGLSIFHNEFSALTADNPCFANAAACGASDGGAAAPRTGQTSLPPSNMAHSLSLSAGVTLPMRTRLQGTFAWGMYLQDETFLPHTINPALNSVDLRLPRTNLGGQVQTFLLNLSAVTRPLRPVTVSAKYRFYSLNDLSDVMTFPGHVVNDRSLTREARHAGRFDYSKQNADVDVRWVILRPVALTVGVGWEEWNRNEHREVPKSDELFGKAALDLTPLEWLSARVTYRPSFRRIDDYHTRAHAEHAVEEDPGAAAQGQSLLLRKYDEGERDRQRIDALVNLMPLESLTFTPAFGWRYDDYIASRLGLQSETAWSAGMDVTWAPTERFSAWAGYLYEKMRRHMRSRSRPVTGATTFDFVDFDWVTDTTDTVQTVHAGVRAVLLPGKLDFTLIASFANALSRTANNNPIAPASGTAAQDATARVRPFPAIEDAMFRLETALRWRFAKAWTASLKYTFEKFDGTDWRSDQLNPFVPGQTSIWLGNDARDFAAHTLAVTVGFSFK